MGKPAELLGDVRGFARDYPRDRLPEGFFWDVADYVPALLDAQLTGRAGWKWASAALPTTIEGGIYATFKQGERLLVIAGGTLYKVNLTDGAVTEIGAVGNVAQNPVKLADQVIVPNTGNTPPKVLTAPDATSVTIGNAGANAATGRFAVTYKGRVLLQGGAGFEERIYFSPPRDATQAWDNTRSWQGTSLPLTGIGALRAMILCFHGGSVERIRGSEPPSEGNPEGDLTLENLFDRAGCGDARSIAYWNDNCIFADERGCHLTDGAIVRNLISQGGLVSYWRALYTAKASLAAEVFLDYYVVTIIRTDGIALTLICDLNRRAWFRFTNIKANVYIRSFGMKEQLWAAREPEHRLHTIHDCFFPLDTITVADADGVFVLPSFETSFHRLGDWGRKRIRFAYTSYDIRTTSSELAQAWREHEGLEVIAHAANGEAKAALQNLLEVGYILTPNQATYSIAGVLPETTDMKRFRLPINKHRYGIGFRFRQTAPSVLTRIHQYEVEAQAVEPSRV